MSAFDHILGSSLPVLFKFPVTQESTFQQRNKLYQSNKLMLCKVDGFQESGNVFKISIILPTSISSSIISTSTWRCLISEILAVQKQKQIFSLLHYTRPQSPILILKPINWKANLRLYFEVPVHSFSQE